MNVYSDISCIKGVGPKARENLNKCGIFTVIDLLLYFPRDYKEVTLYGNLNDANNKEEVIINATLLEIKRDIRTKGGKVLTTLLFSEGENIFKCQWFNQPYMKNHFVIGNIYLLKGKIQIYKGENTLINPSVVKENILSKDTSLTRSIMPIYSLKEGVKNKLLVNLIDQVLKEISIEENLPEEIINRYKFCSLNKAISIIHKPKDINELHEAKRRLKFQELFTYSLKTLLLRNYRNKSNNGTAFKIYDEVNELMSSLPYELTNAQKRVITEILADQKQSRCMNRLVQGDVGSGKTIVAIIALFNIVKNGYQGAFMVPTEILAKQHYKEILKILDAFNVKVELLTGSTTKKQKEKIKEDLKAGNIDIIIGTHTLIEDDVEFYNLGLIITDEQHRFGVMQRSKFFNKGANIDVLVMTATPIPRTMALYLYGDLDISLIDELPPGRQKIHTYCIDIKKKDRAYNFAQREIDEGRQVYIVCPLVEENEDLKLSSVEKLYNELKQSYFQNIEIAILHGKMSSKDKDAIMERFKSNEIKILISTTVIEVGINVPNASLMVVENSERFGLAQLHQLRGRVGRGQYKSYCILLSEIKNEVTKQRMETMVNSSDGFYIAEQDLKIRGTGEIFGLRQHGDEGFILSNLAEDMNLLKEANKEAKYIIKSEDENYKQLINYIYNKLQNSSKYICFN